jgi:hypothetical protein
MFGVIIWSPSRILQPFVEPELDLGIRNKVFACNPSKAAVMVSFLCRKRIEDFPQNLLPPGRRVIIFRETILYWTMFSEGGRSRLSFCSALNRLRIMAPVRPLK